MYVLYTTQSRLRISAPFYLIFYRTYIRKWCFVYVLIHFATPTACIYYKTEIQEKLFEYELLK